jgi:hypothetical protein
MSLFESPGAESAGSGITYIFDMRHTGLKRQPGANVASSRLLYAFQRRVKRYDDRWTTIGN